MRRWWILALLLLVLVGVGVGVGAYHAGYTHGLVQTGHAVQVIREVGPGWGFFPFGFLLFPLFIFLLFGLFRAAFWGRRWGGPGYGHGGGDLPPKGREMFDEWHRRQHEGASGGGPGAGGEPSHA